MNTTNQELTVLSLFDGISCGQQALKELNIPVGKYFASEIEKYPIAITQYNFPKTIQLGNVKNINYIDGFLASDNGTFESGTIDLIIGGSPCTDFSVAGKGAGMSTSDKIDILDLDQYLEMKNNGFEFKGQSYLFWEYVRLMKETGARYFFLENVKMIDKWKNLLSKTVGVEPVFLDSALMSAQLRKRYYWTNIPGYVEPKDYGILLKDIIELGYIDRYKSYCIDANYFKGGNLKNYFEKSRRQLVFSSPDIHRHTKSAYRKLTPAECERLQTLPDQFTKYGIIKGDQVEISDAQRYKALGNGWTVEAVKQFFKNIEIETIDGL